MKDLIIRIKADTQKAVTGVNNLEKELDKLQKTTRKAGNNSTDISKGFSNVNKAAGTLAGTLKTLAAAYVSIEGGKSLVTTAADIEEGFIEIAKTTGIAGDAMDDLKKKLYDMSTEMAGVELGGLQDIAATAGQLGMQSAKDILDFTKVVVKMKATTDLTADEAAKSLSQLGNSLGVAVADYEKLGSAINELSNKTSASAKDVIVYSQRIAGMGKTFGLASSDVLALSSTLKDVGINAELGGTALSEMMIKILKNTQGFAKAAGVSLDEFSRLVKDKPVQAIQLFLESLNKLDKNAKIDVLDKLKLTSSGAAQTILKLSDNTDKLNTALHTSAVAWKQNTSLQKEYDTASKGFNAQMTRARNVIKELAGKVGEELLPKLKEMVDEFVKWVKTLDDEQIKRYAKQITYVATQFGEIIGVLGKYTAAAAGFVASNGKILASLYLLIKTLSLTNGAFQLFGTRVVAAGGEAGGFVKASGSMTTALSSLWKGLTSIIGAAGPWGVAIAAIIGATSGAVKLADDYAEGLKKQADADIKAASNMEKHTGAIEKIGIAYKRADEEMKKHGGVTQETHDKVEKALKGEIAAIEKQLTAWGKTTHMTDIQKRNFNTLAETLGTLKAKLDTLDADYTIDVMADVRQADKALDAVTKRAEKKLTAPLDFDPDTRTADRARDKVGRAITVPVYYKTMNTPPRGTTTGNSRSYATESPTRTRVAPSSNSFTTSTTPVTVPEIPVIESKVDVYFNIDGRKLKAAMKQNTINNLQEYIFREGGF